VLTVCGGIKRGERRGGTTARKESFPIAIGRKGELKKNVYWRKWGSRREGGKRQPGKRKNIFREMSLRSKGEVASVGQEWFLNSSPRWGGPNVTGWSKKRLTLALWKGKGNSQGFTKGGLGNGSDDT